MIWVWRRRWSFCVFQVQGERRGVEFEAGRQSLPSLIWGIYRSEGMRSAEERQISSFCVVKRDALREYPDGRGDILRERGRQPGLEAAAFRHWIRHGGGCCDAGFNLRSLAYSHRLAAIRYVSQLHIAKEPRARRVEQSARKWMPAERIARGEGVTLFEVTGALII